MPTDDQGVRLRGMTFVLQVITLAMVWGVVMFNGHVVLGVGALQKEPVGSTLAFVGLGTAILAFAAQFVVSFVCDTLASRRAAAAPEQDLLSIYFFRTLVALAILEGPAFLNTFALMTEFNSWSLGLAAAMVVLMLLRLPTRTRVEQWLEARRMDASASAADRDEDWPRGNDDFGDRPNA